MHAPPSPPLLPLWGRQFHPYLFTVTDYGAMFVIYLSIKSFTFTASVNLYVPPGHNTTILEERSHFRTKLDVLKSKLFTKGKLLLIGKIS